MNDLQSGDNLRQSPSAVQKKSNRMTPHYVDYRAPNLSSEVQQCAFAVSDRSLQNSLYKLSMATRPEHGLGTTLHV